VTSNKTNLQAYVVFSPWRKQCMSTRKWR